MKYTKKIIKSFIFILLIPIVYLIIGYILTSISVNNIEKSDRNLSIYLTTNGVHLDIILPKEQINKELKNGLVINPEDKFISFGWGDKNFYLHTQTWGDLKFSNALNALFMKSKTLMHVTNYVSNYENWVEIKVTNEELDKLNRYILNSFQEKKGIKKLLIGRGYFENDNFYEANGSYSCFKTCNTWVNSAFKESGIKACLWTAFDYGLIKKHKN